MDTTSIIERNVPRKSSEFISNHQQKKRISAFLNNPKEWAFIVIAPSGSGKTTLCQLILQEHDCNFLRPYYENFTSHKEFVTYIENFIRTPTMDKIFGFEKAKQNVLFLDDIDVLIAEDRYAYSYVQNLVGECRIKVLMTCTAGDEKKLTDIKKKLEYIHLMNPPYKECVCYMFNVVTNSDLNDVVDDTKLMHLCTVMQCNIRNILQNLESCTNNSNFEGINNEVSTQSYFDMNIFDIISKIFSRYACGLQDMEIALSSDPTLISFMLYDNYKGYLALNHDTSNRKEYDKGISFVNNMYISSSIMESEAYVKNDWAVIEWVNIIKCGAIRAVQNNLPIKKNATSAHKLGYTTIMTRSSQHFTNLKRYKKYNTNNDMTMSTSILLWDVVFEKGKLKDKKWAIPTKCEEATLMNPYCGNICAKDNDVYMKPIRLCD
jgi:hypothetical protein